MAKPKLGATYRYGGDAGLGALARVADPNLSDDLPSEMADLDMHPDTVVTVSGHDDERDLVLVEWTDLQGNPRVTSIEPGTFADRFTKEG